MRWLPIALMLACANNTPSTPRTDASRTDVGPGDDAGADSGADTSVPDTAVDAPMLCAPAGSCNPFEATAPCPDGEQCNCDRAGGYACSGRCG